MRQQPSQLAGVTNGIVAEPAAGCPVAAERLAKVQARGRRGVRRRDWGSFRIRAKSGHKAGGSPARTRLYHRAESLTDGRPGAGGDGCYAPRFVEEGVPGCAAGVDDGLIAVEHTVGEIDAGAADGRANSRNGYGKKQVLTETGKIALEVPRDRLSTFDPQLIAKYQRRFPGFDEKIISMYARGMSVREIQGHLRELYGIDVSPDLVSAAVLDEVTEWQNRPLEALYPLIFFDAIRIKVRDEGTVRNKAVYVALGVRPDGTKEILGLWIEQTEGAKFWLRVINELKNRGVEDVLIAIVDGLKGFPEAS